MYSERIKRILKKEKIKIGDEIEVRKNGKFYKGILMPKSVGDEDSIVLKLKSGYNIGIKPEEIRKIKPQQKRKKIRKKLKFDKSKPSVSLIVSGGTIVSRIDYRTGGVYALEKPEELLENVPELKNIVNVKKIIVPFEKMSEDMDYKDWQILAEITAKELKRTEGVIIAHGTDTMGYTSAALSFMLKDLSKPVVLVGSQRSSDRGSSDAFMNLICAAHLAKTDIAEVGVCMHGTLNDDYCFFHRGTKVRKMHTSRRDAFRSINDLPLAKIYPDGRIKILNEYRKRSNTVTRADVKFEPKVALLKTYPGSEPKIIEFLIEKGYKGFVLEGTGMGHVPTFARKSWIKVIKKVSDEIPIVITSQTIYGRVHTHVYTNLRILYESGAIPGEDMLPETAYIKLGWVLGHTKSMEKIREMMLKNISGEITERRKIDTFLI